MKKSKRHYGIERLKSRYGKLFVTPWVAGLILFFIIPLFESVLFCFSNVFMGDNGLEIELIGLENLRYILKTDAMYTKNLTKSIATFTYSFPLIIVLSFILAVILNQRFRGRTFFRALYFLPVIIATGVVMELILKTRSGGEMGMAGVDSSMAEDMIRTEDMVGLLGLPQNISEYIEKAVSSVMDLVWSSGIQIVLFISGMQSIPESLYEVSKVEGASKWEEFWFITLPMLGRIIVLVSVFTIIELMTSKNDPTMSQAYVLMESMNYGRGSSMLWLYFMLIGVIMAALMYLFNRLCLRRWY